MSDKALVKIDKFRLNNPSEIDEFEKSALMVLNATEKDFHEMQQKKWYKRFWEIITFSKDNEKRIARGVASLAKIQEITIKMLIMLSSENKQIVELVESNRDAINNVLKRLNLQRDEFLLLQKMLSHMLYYTRVKLSEISANDREIIMFSTGKYLVESLNANKDVQEYFRNLRNALGVPEAPNYGNFDFNKISDLSDKMSDLLYFNIIAEMTFLAGKSAKRNAPYEKAIAYVDLSKPKQEQVWDRIKNTAKTEGNDALVGYYEANLYNFFVDSEGIDFTENDAYYPEIREIVRYYANAIIDAECITPNSDTKGSIQAFLKDNPNIIVNKKNIISFYDFINEESLRTQLLITVSGFYWAEYGKDLICVSFDSLMEESRVITIIPIMQRKNQDRHWIRNLIDASVALYEKKVRKDEFTFMLNAILKLPKDKLPNRKADEMYIQMDN